MSQMITTEFGRVRLVTLDGVPALLFECPGCKDWVHLDDDQANGRISMDHAGDTASPWNDGKPCTFHQTLNLVAAVKARRVAALLTNSEVWDEEDAITRAVEVRCDAWQANGEHLRAGVGWRVLHGRGKILSAGTGVPLSVLEEFVETGKIEEKYRIALEVMW